VLVTSALSVEISKLPPFESFPFPRAPPRSPAPSPALPWLQSPVGSTATSTSSSEQRDADDPSPASADVSSSALPRAQEDTAMDYGCRCSMM
jgi:hypothetical protein